MWAHLASDESAAELHRFSGALGLRRTAYQGDHYDVDEPTRARALALGAHAVPSRELVRRLTASGLRRRGPRSGLRWEVVAEVQAGDGARLRSQLRSRLGPPGWAELDAAIADVAAAAGRPGLLLAVLRRPGELAVVLRPEAEPWPPVHEVVLEVEVPPRAR